jgi:hypothetical protein
VPLTSEQIEAVSAAIQEDDELVLLVTRDGDCATSLVRPVYGHPAAFGVLIADLIEHVADAYVHAGFDPSAVRAELLNSLGESLEFPMSRPVAVQKAMEDVPRG